MAQPNPPTAILDLEIEVLSMIFSQVCSDSPRTASALALVNKYFNDAVKCVRYVHTTLQWDSAHKYFLTATGRQAKSWKCPEFFRGLRHLTIRQRHEKWRGSETDFADQLTELLGQVSNLRSLTWEIPLMLPHPVLDVLEAQHPRAHLHVRRVRTENYTYSSNSFHDLTENKCLISFGAEIFSDNMKSYHHVALQELLCRAPNLKFASLISDRISPSEVNEWGKWHIQLKPSTSLRHLTLDGWPISADTLEYWSKFVDLATLESFKCSRGRIDASYFTRAAQLLSNLKHVSLNLGAYDCDPETARAAQDYIDTCSPLATLSLWSWSGRISLASVLSKHGPTLKELHLHEREESFVDVGLEQVGTRPYLRQILSPESLAQVRNSCPKLKACTFDLNRHTQFLNIHDYQVHLNELVKAGLDELQIYFDAGVGYISLATFAEDISNVIDDEDENEWPELTLPNKCGGDFDSKNLPPVFWNPESTSDVPQTEIPDHPSADIVTFHPPSSTDDICRFVGELWKYVFGSRTSGERLLEVKFGEWDRKYFPLGNNPDGEKQKDIRVYCRAKPHERDDKVGECQILMQCCGGKHWKKFASG
ncbi:hypothetical protein A1O1_04794 [Capronia coronata CBS 617.96]|uniref:F-box domain-containing protein n=1 Tax=Capronia coronata CBS 617.96 TaxID=1182541 RepID=W9Y505_9EURO|nr:uncharacterized protein A1O1_04794 [Capronia coronata CBS 617.96]EXJ87867.1 hypothetical protein A1O1_04794 [Capronia coronata CBS 617.96]